MTRKAIVTGATSGIGMEVAKLLAERGWQVGIAGRRIERLKELKRSHEGIVCYRQIDVTSPDAPQMLRHLIDELGGRICISTVRALVGKTTLSTLTRS